jgi:cell division inhibitor SepF
MIMEEMVLQDRPGLFTRLAALVTRREEEFEDEFDPATATPEHRAFTMKSTARYTITVRRQITSFEDAMAAANGLKSGEQQILNLASTESALRQKIVDFMCGVNYAQEGTWEEIGENIFLVVPANAYVEVAPATPRMSAIKN